MLPVADTATSRPSQTAGAHSGISIERACEIRCIHAWHAESSAGGFGKPCDWPIVAGRNRGTLVVRERLPAPRGQVAAAYLGPPVSGG